MKRLPMRKIRDALRLRASGLSLREIGLSLGLGRSTVGEYIRRAVRGQVAREAFDKLQRTIRALFLDQAWNTQHLADAVEE